MNRNYLSLVAAAAGDGVRNIGYNNGIVDGRRQAVRRVRVGPLDHGPVPDRPGREQRRHGVLATGTVAVDGTDTWKKYDVTLTATGTTDAGRLAVLAGAPSTVALDMVSVHAARHAGSARSTAARSCARTSPRRSRR